MFFRLFFRLSAHFRPHSSAIFHPNTPHIVARYQHMINDDLSKKKSPHFREKYLVLSYLKEDRWQDNGSNEFLLPYACERTAKTKSRCQITKMVASLIFLHNF